MQRWMHRLRVAEALGLLCLARLLVRRAPFRRVAPLLGRPGMPGRPDAAASPRAAAHAEAVACALAAAAGRLPWASTCLMRTLAGRLMLARRGVPCVARFGVTAAPGADRAHAWLSVGGYDVTGGAAAADYRPIADFSGPRR